MNLSTCQTLFHADPISDAGRTFRPTAELKPSGNPPWSIQDEFGQQLGRVLVCLAKPDENWLCRPTALLGLYLRFEPYLAHGANGVGWIQHIVELDGRIVSMRGRHRQVCWLTSPPRYDNAAARTDDHLLGPRGSRSDPFNLMRQPTEKERPAVGSWPGNPWYGGAGDPAGGVPRGHSAENPRPQSSIFVLPTTRPEGDASTFFIAQLVCNSGPRAGRVLLSLYWYAYADQAGQPHFCARGVRIA